VNLGKVTPNFYVGISALEKNNNVEVRSMPKLSTLNGHEASLSIGSKRYYSIKTQNVLGSLNPQTVVTQQYQSVEANLNINIRPVVSGDDQVTLNIDVNISDFLGEPSVDSPPPTSTSQFKSIIRVRNEEMVVLGGIERNEKNESGSGVPILSRIPIIKWLFSSRTKSKSKLVSVVFIKPTIIY
jgi:type IV pilus assembly protein PilQ